MLEISAKNVQYVVNEPYPPRMPQLLLYIMRHCHPKYQNSVNELFLSQKSYTWAKAESSLDMKISGLTAHAWADMTFPSGGSDDLEHWVSYKMREDHTQHRHQIQRGAQPWLFFFNMDVV